MLLEVWNETWCIWISSHLKLSDLIMVKNGYWKFPQFSQGVYLDFFHSIQSIYHSLFSHPHPPTGRPGPTVLLYRCMYDPHIYIAYTYIYVMLMFLRSLDRLFSTCLPHVTVTSLQQEILLPYYTLTGLHYVRGCQSHVWYMKCPWHDSHSPCWPSSLAKLNNFWYLLWLLCCLSNWRTPPKKCNLGSRHGVHSELLTVGF